MDKDVTYDQPTATPVPKMSAVGIAGAVVVLLVFAAKTVFAVEITAEVATAATAIIAFAAGYFKKDVKPAEVVKIIEGKS